MEVILKRAYKKLGQKGDVVSVKAGYGRNYLIPKGIAMVADLGNKKVILENARQAASKSLKLKEIAQELVRTLDSCKVVVKAKVGEEGKIFGSVTALQISKSLKEQGIVVDYNKIALDSPIKQVGAHKAILYLHEEVTYILNFNVVAL